MVMPGTDGTAPIEVNETSSTYDELVQSAAGFANEAAQLKADIAYYEQLVDKQNKKIVSNVSANEANEADLAKYTYDVETQVKYLTKAMTDVISLTNQTVDEYFSTEVFKDAVKINVPASYVSSVKESFKIAFLIIMGGTFLGLMLGILLVLGKDIFKEQNTGNDISI